MSPSAISERGLTGVRFAPSPTGPFHVGNFRTAWISRGWARRLGVPWVVRFEDIDAPRNAPGARERQLEEMALLGLRPDEIRIQSESRVRHWDSFLRAAREGKAYPCFCSRKDVRESLAGAASAPHGPAPLYGGRCRGLETFPATSLPSIAWRFRMEPGSGAEDFIVARTAPVAAGLSEPEGEFDERVPDSFVPSYNWACAVDDFDGDYRLLVRAADLAAVVGQQRAVQALLSAWDGRPRAPAVYHCALVVQDSGERLEKRTRGVTLPELLARGHSPEAIAERFERSFDFAGAPDRVRAGEVLGEARATVTLSELGFSQMSA